jgi:hypothetical protein
MSQHVYDVYDRWRVVVHPGPEFFGKPNKAFEHRGDGFAITCLKNWLHENLEKGTWKKDGITRISWRFYFEHEEDAVMFKLVFNI